MSGLCVSTPVPFQLDNDGYDGGSDGGYAGGAGADGDAGSAGDAGDADDINVDIKLDIEHVDRIPHRHKDTV